MSQHQEQALSMYPLLPTMQDATVPLLQQAIQEMTEHYTGEKLSRRLLWFKTLLGRVKTIPLEDREKVTEEIQMLDEFLEDDPYVQTLVERGIQKRFQNFTEQFNAQAAEQARLAIEQANAQAAEQARQAIEQANAQATEQARLAIEQARQAIEQANALAAEQARSAIEQANTQTRLACSVASQTRRGSPVC